MSITKRLFLSVATLLLSAGVLSASSFRAADIVYLPAVARLQGGAGSFFKTDVTITNTSPTARVVVSVAYMPTGGGDNSTAPNTLKTLATLAPGERREITDIAQTVLGLDAANGFLIFFACREGGNCSACDTNATDCINITVSGRIYNDTGNGTFGQSFPGIPWYNFVSVNSADRGLDTVSVNGVRQETNFRSNIGMLNSSQFSTTTLRLKLFTSTGTLVGTKDQVLGPLGHIQYPVTNIASTFSGTGYITIEQVAVTPAPGQTDANPGFMAYGSLIDNRTNDPTTLEAQYNVALPFDCVYGSKPQKRQVKRQ